MKQRKLLEAENNQNENKSKMQIQMIKKKRLCKNIEPKTYFQFLICDRNYINLSNQSSEMVENLYLITSNRKSNNIFLLTSNPTSLITAKECNFCVIPISQYSNDGNTDIQLNLVENYLLKLRYTTDMKSKNDIDFGYLKNKEAIKNHYKSSVVSRDLTSDQSSYENGSLSYLQSSLTSQ